MDVATCSASSPRGELRHRRLRWVGIRKHIEKTRWASLNRWWGARCGGTIAIRGEERLGCNHDVRIEPYPPAAT